VVWLPGRTGAAVVEVEAGKPFRAVLPVPIDARGAVTLGGRPSAGVNARLRIVAAHQGAGDLDAALSPSTTADADGTFVFRGLTPGRYKVQAARDGIWLSQSVELTVEPAQPPAELALDIPEPGAPLAVEIVNRKGRPVPQLPLTLMRPDGPLATLWPTDFHTDAAGQLTLRGLEAGSHSIRLDGDPTPRRFQVPEARGQAREPEVVRFVFEETP
jgi:hypothetical protein